MTGIYLLLGSNLGDRAGNLRMARQYLSRCEVIITGRSSIYNSAPWGMRNVMDFYNQVVKVETSLDPFQLLDEVQAIEIALGRNRSSAYTSRRIDIDILYYRQQVISHPRLQIPHPMIQERKFTLEPLAEIAPNFVHPVLGLTNRQLLDQCADPLSVTLEPIE